MRRKTKHGRLKRKAQRIIKVGRWRLVSLSPFPPPNARGGSSSLGLGPLRVSFPRRNKRCGRQLALEQETPMTMNNPDPNRYPANNPRNRRPGTANATGGIIALVVMLVIGGIYYMSSDHNHTQATNSPATTTGSGIAKTPLTSTSPVATAPSSTMPAPSGAPAGSGTQRP